MAWRLAGLRALTRRARAARSNTTAIRWVHPTPRRYRRRIRMNMDYIPVCEEEAGDGPGTVKLSLDRVQRLGVRSEEVAERPLVPHCARLRHPAVRRAPPVRRRAQVRRLDREALRQRDRRRRDCRPEAVRRLQPRTERPAAAMAGRAAAVPMRPTSLRYLAYPEAALERLRQGDPPSRTVTIPSPVAGTVVDKIAIEGMRFQPGETLFRIVDTSRHVGDGRSL